MGAGIAASPQCAERRICRCSQPWQFRPKPKPPVFDPGSPAQASLSSQRLSLRKSNRPTELQPRGIAGLSTVPTILKAEPPVKVTRCSAALLGMTTTASRFAHRNSEEPQEPRRATEKSSLPAPRTGWLPGCPRRNAPTACRQEIGSSVPSSRGRLGHPPRSPVNHATSIRVAEAKNLGTGLWKTGISGTTAGTFRHLRVQLLESPRAPTSLARARSHSAID